MPNSLPKIIASILLGMVFLFGGAGVVSAQATAVDQANSILKAVSCTDWVDCLQKLPTLIPLDISYALYILTAGILALAGYAFDSVLTMSIDHTFILKPFIDTMWTTIRDFSNMAFIFILLYTGIITMLGQPGWAKTVRNVVIIALLINFSLFFTKVVIDAGNILAVGVYEALAPIKTEKIHTTPAVGGLQERDLSLELTKHFGPQAILGKSADVSSPFLAIMLFVIGAVVNILAAWAFSRVALMFIGRIIGFWVLMIISPFAFISISFPGGQKVFDAWLKNLLGLSFVAPVFLFFLYIIMQVLSSGAIASTLATPNPDSFAKFSLDVLFVPVLMVIFIYMALDKAVSFSKQMAGGFGDLGAKIGGTVMGVAGGVALGGTALAGRAVGGKLAAKAFEGGTMQRWAASEKTGLLGAAQRNLGMRGTMALDTARSASWDARNVGLVSKGIKATGVDVGKAGGKGGYVQGEKDWLKEQKKKAALMELTSDEKKAIEKEAKGKAELAGEKTVRAKLMVADAKEKHENSDGARLVAARTKQLDDERSKLEEAKKNTNASQVAFDSAKNIGRIDPALKAARDAAEKAEEETMSRMMEAKSELEKATVEHANSATASVLKTATESLTSAQQDEAKAIDALKNVGKKIKEEDERRRGAYAEQITPEITPVAGQVAGGVGGFMAAGPVGMAAGGVVGAALGAKFGPKVVSEERKKKIAAIRAGKSDDDKKKEDETALLKDIAKKIKEAEGADH